MMYNRKRIKEIRERPDELDLKIWKLKDEGLSSNIIAKRLGIPRHIIVYSYQVRRRLNYLRELDKQVEAVCEKNY